MPNNPASFHRFHLILLFVALGVYFVTAINSKGYLHYDEHYQIIEFADLKLGVNEPSDLAWEYQAQIRPALQPAICFVLFKGLNAVGITDAYDLALSLRLLSLALTLTAISLFVRSSLPLVEQGNGKLYILLSYFLWILPFLNVRFSSETWSGGFFLFAVAILQLNLSKQKRQSLLTGLLLGLSFLCRFQSAFLILSLLLWLVIIHKEPLKSLLKMMCGVLAALLAGTAIDYWFYGEFVFTPWNYFNANILQGVASSFGTSPWYHYISVIFNDTTFPIGCLILFCISILIYKKPQLLVIWILLPFLIVHSIIPHKEDRFLIPLINFIPLILILGWQEIQTLVSQGKRFYQGMAKCLASVLLLINALGLAVMTFKPIGNGTKAITYYIHKNYKNQNVRLIWASGSNPYNPLYFIPLRESFYNDLNVQKISLDQTMELNYKEASKTRTILFAVKKSDQDYPDCQTIISRYHLTLKTQSMPTWIEKICRYTGYLGDDDVITLYGNQ